MLADGAGLGLGNLALFGGLSPTANGGFTLLISSGYRDDTRVLHFDAGLGAPVRTEPFPADLGTPLRWQALQGSRQVYIDFPGNRLILTDADHKLLDLHETGLDLRDCDLTQAPDRNLILVGRED